MEQIEMFTAPAPKRTRAARIRSVEAKRPKVRRPIEERFREFDAKFPEVRAELRRLAMQLLAEGRRRISINQLFEVARYNLRSRTDIADGEGLRLNNSYRALMSRALIADVPALGAVIETRELRSK